MIYFNTAEDNKDKKIKKQPLERKNESIFNYKLYIIMTPLKHLIVDNY